MFAKLFELTKRPTEIRFLARESSCDGFGERELNYAPYYLIIFSFI